ncbi:MAG: S8 family peptidase [Bacteroidia bacterium]|nr:S8 family peptidase [Bacteroidia bacterium]
MVARGNEGFAQPQNSMSYPAVIDDDWILCVGGTGTDGNYMDGFGQDEDNFAASKGWEIDVAAPATSDLIRSTITNGGYHLFNGTSAAAPHVSGTVGLLLSYLNHPFPHYDNLSPEDCEEVLQMTALDVNYKVQPGVDPLIGYGRLDAGKALRQVSKAGYKLAHYGTDAFFNTKTLSLHSQNDTILLKERYENAASQWFKPAYPYVVNTWRIEARVYHSLPVFDTLIAAWPRPSSSNLLPLFDGQNTLLARERISLDAVNQFYADLSGYVYQVSDTAGNNLGWWPFDTSLAQAQLTYSLLLVDTTIAIARDKPLASSPVQIYPNPTRERQTLSLETASEGNLQITLYDLQGRLMRRLYEGKVGADRKVLNFSLEGLPAGMYIYHININDQVHTLKAVKQ